MTNTLNKPPFTLPAWVMCPNCNAPLQPEFPDDIEGYFGGRATCCPGCGKAVDLWDTLVRAARKHFMLTGAFQLLGCRKRFFRSPSIKGRSLR